MNSSPSFFSTYAYIEARNADASITIGDGTSMNNNFCAVAEHTRITIGKDCLIGANVEIYDSDFHGVRVAERHTSLPERARAVIIGDHVFIGSNVKILKGVTIGDGAVIGHGSLVTGDVAGGTVAAGVPARAIKAID
ncbi:MAG TPA: acyltransferase [Caulobacteraceae bacterium]